LVHNHLSGVSLIKREDDPNPKYLAALAFLAALATAWAHLKTASVQVSK
jgi:hypothetical protein